MTDFERKQIEKILKSIPNRLNVMEQEIDFGTIEEYFEISDSLESDAFTDEDVVAKSQTLFAKNASIHSKKKVLILLAHSAAVRSYRSIEKYLENPDQELKGWALLALQDCRTLLESCLLEQGQGIISTGLGGSESKLRYFVLITSAANEPFTENQIDTGSFGCSCRACC